MTKNEGRRPFEHARLRPFAKYHGIVRDLQDMKRTIAMLAESDEEDMDEMKIDTDDKISPWYEHGGGPLACLERDRLRRLDGTTLSVQYWEAVLGMSSPIDLATATKRMSETTNVCGSLWEVCHSSTDQELPNVLCHFLKNTRDERGGSLLKESFQAAKESQNESDEELEHMQNAFNVVASKLHSIKDASQAKTSHVGLRISNLHPYKVLSVHNILDLNGLGQQEKGYANPHVCSGDYLISVDGKNVEHATPAELHNAFDGLAYSIVSIVFIRGSSRSRQRDMPKVRYSVQVLRQPAGTCGQDFSSELIDSASETDSLRAAVTAADTSFYDTMDRARAMGIEMLMSSAMPDHMTDEPSILMNKSNTNLAWHQDARGFIL